jgi:hypothetical protein
VIWSKYIRCICKYNSEPLSSMYANKFS